MKKFYSLVVVLCIACIGTVHSQQIINLGVSDGVAAKITSDYAGTSDSVIVVVPAGYTYPEYAAGAIGLATISTSIKKLVIKGDGTKPTLLTKGFTLPATGLTSFTVKDLMVKGIEDTGSALAVGAGSYVISGTFAVGSVNFTNCSISNYRGVIRMKASCSFTNLTIDKCIISNIGGYNILNTEGSPIPTLTNFTIKNSTVYGTNGTVFSAATAVPGTFTISDCTFDNLGYASGKYLIDFGTTNTTTVLKINNTILGKTINAGFIGIRSGASYTVNNSYITSDWTTASSAVIGFTTYASASTALFTTPTTFTCDASANAMATVGNYTIKDASFAGKNSAGDPRWYLGGATAVQSPNASSTVISYNGKEISLNEAQDVTIYSVTGDLLKSAKSVTVIAVGNLSHGIYIVKAGNTVQKFIVQ